MRELEGQLKSTGGPGGPEQLKKKVCGPDKCYFFLIIEGCKKKLSLCWQWCCWRRTHQQ